MYDMSYSEQNNNLSNKNLLSDNIKLVDINTLKTFKDLLVDNLANNLATKEEVQELINSILYNEEIIATALTDLNDRKQDILVSGENIKTINGINILGNGDITITSSSSINATLSDGVLIIGN